MAPPDNLPIYRLLTGPDDAAFCRRVSEALALGYALHGSPAATFNGQTVIVAQALVWPGALRKFLVMSDATLFVADEARRTCAK